MREFPSTSRELDTKNKEIARAFSELVESKVTSVEPNNMGERIYSTTVKPIGFIPVDTIVYQVSEYNFDEEFDLFPKDVQQSFSIAFFHKNIEIMDMTIDRNSADEAFSYANISLTHGELTGGTEADFETAAYVVKVLSEQ